MLSRDSIHTSWLLQRIICFQFCIIIASGGFACLSNPCIHGVCIDDLNTTYSCYCIDGYTGIQCQTNWDECWSNPCQNGGRCHDGIAMFNCTCAPGYVGDLCEEDYNECESNPCLNNGTCIDRTNGYNCMCLPGYSGIHCEIDIAVCNATNETRCANGGVCLEGPGITFSCKCPSGWGGPLCDSEIDECMSAPCQNGAVCIDLHADYACACLFGFTGKNCEEVILQCNDNPCRNGALCLTEDGHPVCYCVPDFHGDRCQYQYDECQLGPRCMNGGTCIDGIDSFTCSCPQNLTGVLCECLIIGRNNLDCTYTITTSETTPKWKTTTTETTTFQQPDTTFSTVPNVSISFTSTSEFFTTFPTYSTEVSVVYTSPEGGGEFTTSPVEATETVGLTTISEEPSVSTIEILLSETPTQAQGASQKPEATTGIDVGSTELSIGVTKASVGPTEVPVGPTETSVGSTEESVGPTEVTVGRTEAPVGTTEAPVGATEESVRPTEASVSSSEASVSSSEAAVSPTVATVGPTEVSAATSETSVASPEVTISPPQVPVSPSEAPTSTSQRSVSPPNASEASASASTASVLPPEASSPPTKPTLTPISETTTEESATETLTQTPIPTVTSFTFDTSVSSTTTHVTSTEFEEPTTLTIEETGTSVITTTTNVSSAVTITSEIATLITTATPFLTEEPLTTSTSFFETTTFMEYTTLSRENATKAIAIDCSKLGFGCQHGGTCMYSGETYKCVCPYDAEGPLCEIKLGIRNAAFSGDSYLTHKLMNTSGTKVEFSTKTLSPSGLIFHSNIDKTYMALYLEGGYLKFIFSCGYQTMLLSELRNPVNDGFEMSIKAELEFSKDFKRCNATVMVNNTLTMSGNQIAIVNQLMKPVSVLHLGGLPQEKFKEHIPSLGFMGCITSLKVFGKPVEVFMGAEDGYRISECSSLACLSNPCNNGGTCVENSSDDWHCNCKNGYLGKFCENSVCDNNPCLFGATCLTFTGSGYICLCPFGKHGHFCENDLEITEPYFSSSIRGFSSYAAYPIPTGGIVSNMELKFKFTPSTMDQISILMFIGQNGIHDTSSDHMAVSFVKGYIMLTWNLGSGPRRIFTSTPLSKSKTNYMLRLGRFGRRAWISVDGMQNITGRSPGNLAQLDVAPILYLGGHNSPNFSILPHDLPLHTGFSGCIYDVELKSGNLVIPLQSSRQVAGRALGQCGTTECHENLCQNGGACLYHGGTFTCLCQDGWFGPLCSSRHNPCDSTKNNCSSSSECVPLLTGYECDCPIGKTGRYCKNDQILSDVSLTGRRSYILLKPIDLDDVKFSIEVQLRPLSDRGLILFIGQSGSSFVSLVMQSGLLELRVLPAKRRFNGNEVVSIRSNKLLAMGMWYTVRLGKYGNRLFLEVDNILSTGVLNNGDSLSVAQESIFLGGLPDMSEVPTAAVPSLPIPFTGCLRQLSVNSRRIPLDLGHIITARNVEDCDGTPCGGDACENGGTCWLDSNLKPHCSCPEPYIGEKCQTIPPCPEKPCENKGRCLNSRCICVVGYSGAFCEAAIKVEVPEFYGNSHLVLKKITGGKRRALQDVAVYDVYVNFTTTAKDGLILWNSKENTYIGIGIEKGYLKFAYSTENKSAIEAPSTKFISDGLWHTIELSLTPFRFYLRLDRKLLQTQKSAQLKNTDMVLMEDVFYLGGLPSVMNQLEVTHGLFPVPFAGCIEAIAFNKEQPITEFSGYDGENIGVCKF